jgi:hypothetical protein
LPKPPILLINVAGEWRGFNRTGKTAAACREIRRGFGLLGRATRAPLPHPKSDQEVGRLKPFGFPAGGRAALGGRRNVEAKPAVDQESSRVSAAAFGGGWYHEAAIQESEPERKR